MEVVPEGHGPFPYERSQWHPDGQIKARWAGELSRVGAANVRARLVQYQSGSWGTISVGNEVSITRGFVEEWLAWQDAAREAREEAYRGEVLRWLRVIACACVLIAAGVVLRAIQMLKGL
jgi:hypothetical protein